jgi:hypothetical protein
MFIFILLMTIVFVALAFLAGPRNEAMFAIALTGVGIGVPYLMALRFEDIPLGLRLRSLLCSTIYRWRYIRISVAYLVRVIADDHYLLVRGRRIPTQFQPVGGVYKVRQDVLKNLQEEYGVTPDKRFVGDADNAGDLRVMVPGRSVAAFLKWIGRRRELETAPWREFYEELVRPGHLDAETFATPHFEFVKTYATRLHFDRYSDHYQLLIYDVFDLHLTDQQTAELRRLREQTLDENRIAQTQPLAFFSHMRLAEPASPARASAAYEIAPHVRWIISSRKS